MANVVLKLNYNALTKTLDRVAGGIGEVIKSGTIEEATSVLVTTELSTKIKDKYNKYLGDISSFEHNVSDFDISVTDTKKGWVLHARGDDLLYHEYGTGTRGLKDPHPLHDKKGMNPYGSGRNVIQGTYQIKVEYNTELLNGLTDKKYKPVKWMYINKNNGKKAPYWYPLFIEGIRDFPNDFGDEKLKSSDYVWKHNGKITKGLPAGKFIYESCEEIANYDVSGGSETLKRTITQTIKKELVSRKIEKYESLKNK